MCAESLVNYLISKTGVPYDDMKAFIVDGEFMKDEDYNNRGEHRLPQTVHNKLREIDKALETIRVADPAVGSGAFPLGMLSEIVKARNNITYYYAAMLTTAEERARIFNQRELYTLKWQTIQNCIFAVDIEASAVDIAKLRLWLSLVVDEDLSPTYDEQRYGNTRQKDPRPLPNLDYNIMCGNSLIDEFEGIQLFDDALLGREKSNAAGIEQTMQMSLFMDSMTIMLDDLRREQERLFGEQNQETKHEIKKKIDKIIVDIIRAKLNRDNNAEGLRKYEDSLKQKTKPYFLWKLEFARVFRENGGFDVVIGNPPYFVFEKEHTQNIDDIKLHSYSDIIGTGKINAYRAFIAKTLYSLIKHTGIMCMIFQNSFLGDKSVGKLRKYIFDNHNIIRIDSFPERDNVAKRVFENVKMSVCILFLRTGINTTSFQLNMYSDKHFSKSYSNTLNYLDIEKLDNKNYCIPMLNPRELLVLLKTHSNKNIELRTYQGEINMTVHKHLLSERSDYPEVLKGAAIQRYRITTKMSQGKREYLNVSLYKNENSGEKSTHYQHMRIAMQGITGVDDKRRLIATIIPASFFLAHSCNYILKPLNADLEYVLGILNSSLMNWIFKKTSTNSNVNSYEVEQLPILIAQHDVNKVMISNVKQIIALKEADHTADTSELEAEIDRMVYDLYGLTNEEIKIVEESVNK
jgi:Alw26I/Eco31I/Esp3I family type II restriction m6 adenine DNA methyltransferase